MEAFNRLDVDGFVESATPDFEWFPVGAGHSSAAASWGLVAGATAAPRRAALARALSVYGDRRDPYAGVRGRRLANRA